MFVGSNVYHLTQILRLSVFNRQVVRLSIVPILDVMLSGWLIRPGLKRFRVNNPVRINLQSDISSFLKTGFQLMPAR